MTASKVLEIARAQIGVKESPPNSNKVLYNTWYYGYTVSGAAYPWCMTFVQWVMNQAKVNVPIKTASCSALMTAAQKAGQWVTKNYQPGDVLIYTFNSARNPSHTGILESVSGSTVTAIEGNTAIGNDSDGGEVMRRTRNVSTVLGAWRPKYMEDTMTDKEVYDALQRYMATQAVPTWADKEFEEAKKAGITDGSNPMDLIPRYQAAIMCLRAMKKK